ncbi:hypothetical protein ACIGPN_36955 [Streptomyces afghaniensis]|uniref:hypothetical protein n=1 Tax=Streptomyces afghaniensis TaxID=66865 RepID=UPI0037D19CDE
MTSVVQECAVHGRERELLGPLSGRRRAASPFEAVEALQRFREIKGGRERCTSPRQRKRKREQAKFSKKLSLDAPVNPCQRRRASPPLQPASRLRQDRHSWTIVQADVAEALEGVHELTVVLAGEQRLAAPTFIP